MKHYPRGPRKSPPRKTGQWFRTKNKHTQWIYFFYDGHVADLRDFARGIVGSFHRRTDPVVLVRPPNICHMPYAQHRGVELFLENL